MGCPGRAQPAPPSCPGILPIILLALCMAPQLPDAAVAEQRLRHVTAWQYHNQLIHGLNTLISAARLAREGIEQGGGRAAVRLQVSIAPSTCPKGIYTDMQPTVLSLGGLCVSRRAYLRELPSMCAPGLQAA